MLHPCLPQHNRCRWKRWMPAGAAVRGSPTPPAWGVCPGQGAGGLQARWDGLAVAARAPQQGGGSPHAWLLPSSRVGASCLGTGKGLLSPPPSLRLPSKAAPGRACCEHSHSWPSSAPREPAVIPSVTEGLGACSTPLKKQENNDNNNNDPCSGMLPSGVRIVFGASGLRKLFTLQP